MGEITGEVKRLILPPFQKRREKQPKEGSLEEENWEFLNLVWSVSTGMKS
jgi:hypothetical protein